MKVKRRKTESEKRATQVRQVREAKYLEVREKAVREEGRAAPSVWGFESLFPDTVWDDESVYQDLYSNNKKGGKTFLSELAKTKGTDSGDGAASTFPAKKNGNGGNNRRPGGAVSNQIKKIQDVGNNAKLQAGSNSPSQVGGTNSTSTPVGGKQVNKVMTRMVEDKVFGYRRSPAGDFEYDTSLMGDGAVQFRDGRRLGNALKVNADRLNYHAKCEFRHGRLEEARELYEQAIEMDPRDGRAYLGLSRIAQRRRDFAYARKCLRAGISNSFSRQERSDGTIVGDNGANPFLLQALGCLEERVGNLSEAEALYVEAAKSRPCHAAAWVSLAQLRTRKFRQGAQAGRVCYQTAELELHRAGLPPSSFVYTAWAAMEYQKASDVRLARELFEKALKADPKCSAAWLQLGVMEADKENWERAQECFESALKKDQRNARILQAYAIMETKRPDGSSRTAIELFERALKVKPRDAGVLQAYALYVAKLGDIDTARDLLHRGTTVDKRHAPVWQAWGVLETRYGDPDDARDIFQQGIWHALNLVEARVEAGDALGFGRPGASWRRGKETTQLPVDVSAELSMLTILMLPPSLPGLRWRKNWETLAMPG
jgi:tetratricopeptide (TPR) repeat protein